MVWSHKHGYLRTNNGLKRPQVFRDCKQDLPDSSNYTALQLAFFCCGPSAFPVTLQEKYHHFMCSGGINSRC